MAGRVGQVRALTRPVGSQSEGRQNKRHNLNKIVGRRESEMHGNRQGIQYVERR
jgi:hypothetical protein